MLKSTGPQHNQGLTSHFMYEYKVKLGNSPTYFASQQSVKKGETKQRFPEVWKYA